MVQAAYSLLVTPLPAYLNPSPFPMKLTGSFSAPPPEEKAGDLQQDKTGIKKGEKDKDNAFS